MQRQETVDELLTKILSLEELKIDTYDFDELQKLVKQVLKKRRDDEKLPELVTQLNDEKTEVLKTVKSMSVKLQARLTLLKYRNEVESVSFF